MEHTLRTLPGCLDEEVSNGLLQVEPQRVGELREVAIDVRLAVTGIDAVHGDGRVIGF